MHVCAVIVVSVVYFLSCKRVGHTRSVVIILEPYTLECHAGRWPETKVWPYRQYATLRCGPQVTRSVLYMWQLMVFWLILENQYITACEN